MRDVEFPNSGRRVRSADAAVFKAVEHEAARERESQQQEQRRVRSAPQIDQSNIPAFTRNPQSDGRMTSQVRQQPSRQAHLTRGPEPVRRPRAEEQPAPAKAKKAPKAKTQNKYTKAVSASEPKAKKRATTPLLFVLFFVLIFGVIFAGAVFIYMEDTSLIVPENTIEAGQTANLDMYITGKPMFGDYVSCNLDFSTVNYTLPQTIRFTVTMYGTNFPCVLNIVDTTPPSAEGIAQNLYSVDELPPVEECITNVYDLNSVTMEWVEIPDITAGGSFVAKASVKDASGNETLVEVPLQVTRDTIAPFI